MEKVKTLPNAQKASDDKKKQQEMSKKLSKAIGMAIEMESNFKLYSYRIVEPEVFLSRIDELVNFYKNAK